MQDILALLDYQIWQRIWVLKVNEKPKPSLKIYHRSLIRQQNSSENTLHIQLFQDYITKVQIWIKNQKTRKKLFYGSMSKKALLLEADNPKTTCVYTSRLASLPIILYYLNSINLIFFLCLSIIYCRVILYAM